MDNRYFDSARKKALHFLRDNDTLDRLLLDSKEKIQSLNLDKFQLDQLIEYLRLFSRMVRSYADGSYRVIPWQSILVIVAAIVYFVMPLDLVPDFIPIAGFVDDLGVLIWVFNKLRDDIDAYLDWEEEVQLS